jgi:hypothetical protein
MRNTTAGGDGNGFGVMLAVIMLMLGVAVFAATVGFSKAVFLLKHAF